MPDFSDFLAVTVMLSWSSLRRSYMIRFSGRKGVPDYGVDEHDRSASSRLGALKHLQFMRSHYQFLQNTRCTTYDIRYTF